MWADGVTEDLSKGDRELALGVLFSGLKKDCMEHGFKDAPVCRPGEMRSITSAVVKGKDLEIGNKTPAFFKLESKRIASL